MDDKFGGVPNSPPVPPHHKGNPAGGGRRKGTGLQWQGFPMEPLAGSPSRAAPGHRNLNKPEISHNLKAQRKGKLRHTPVA